MANKKIKFDSSLLIATPSIDEDSLFRNSLVYIDKKNSDSGYLGLLVNKPSDILVSELLKTISINEGPCYDQVGKSPVYIGGPVNNSRLYILYAEDSENDDIEPKIGISNSENFLQKLVLGQGPKRYLIMMGCSMWTKSQLHREYVDNSWVHMPYVASIIFDENPEQRALLAARHLGFNLDLMHA